MNNNYRTIRRKIDPDRMRFFRRVIYFFGLMLGGGFFLYQVVSGIRLLFQHKQVFGQPYWLLLSVLLAVLVTWMQMMGWQWLMTGLGAQLEWKYVLQGYILSFIPRYIPGSVWGYISRGEWLNRSFNISFGITNIGSVLEMFFILVANIAWIITGWISNSWVRVLVIALALLAGLAGWWCVRWLAEKPVFVKVFGTEAAEATRNFSLQRWLLIIGWMIIFWGMQGLSFQLVIWSISQPTQVLYWSLDEYWKAASSYNLAWFVGFIILFVPAGLGLRETVLTGLIQKRMNQAAGMASIVSILFRVILALGEAFWALIALGQGKKPMFQKDDPSEKMIIQDVTKK